MGNIVEKYKMKRKFEERYHLYFSELRRDQLQGYISDIGYKKVFVHEPTQQIYKYDIKEKFWQEYGKVLTEEEKAEEKRKDKIMYKSNEEDKKFLTESPEKLWEQLNLSFTKMKRVKKENGIVFCIHTQTNTEYQYHIEEKIWSLVKED